ncbi:MAG: hypothetical protein IJ309_07570 [Clostridia bacterium]|nr:hypothetical protein [Clostridia bacterium]MBQ7907809.1 hypothetical protein [Clostridia bacterium]
MKYVSPKYSIESIETEDIMGASANVTQTENNTDTSMTFDDLINMFTK